MSKLFFATRLTKLFVKKLIKQSISTFLFFFLYFLIILIKRETINKYLFTLFIN